MKFAFSLPFPRFLPQPAGSNLAVVRRMSQALETAGFDAGLISEHPAPSSDWLRNDPAAHDCLDPFTALAMAAACTTRLQVFTNILVLPYRNPFLTAKAAATLQILSDSRLILGVGTGYMKEEFEALGVEFGKRGKLTDEALETIRLAWRGGSVVKEGLNFSANGVEPRPIPSPPPPIWVGGGSDKAIERAARFGDGWAPFFTVPTNDPVVMRSSVVSMEHFAQKSARLHALRDEMGMTASFDISVAPPFRPAEATASNARRFLDEVAQLEDMGVNWIWTSLPSHTLEQYLELADWFGEEIIRKHNG